MSHLVNFVKSIPQNILHSILIADQTNQNERIFLHSITKELEKELNYYIYGTISSSVTYVFNPKKCGYDFVSKIPTTDTIISKQGIYNLYGNNAIYLVIRESNISHRDFGIIVLNLEKNETANVESTFAVEETRQLLDSISALISLIFSAKYKTRLDGTILSTYQDMTKVSGLKEKTMIMELLNGLRSHIPFDHSVSFFTYDEQYQLLTFTGEKFSRNTPNYDNVKIHASAGLRINCPSSLFFSIPTKSFSVHKYVKDDNKLQMPAWVLPNSPNNIQVFETIINQLTERYKNEISSILFRRISIRTPEIGNRPSRAFSGLLVLTSRQYYYSKSDAAVMDYFIKKGSFFDLVLKTRSDFETVANWLNSSFDVIEPDKIWVEEKIKDNLLRILSTELKTNMEVLLSANIQDEYLQSIFNSDEFALEVKSSLGGVFSSSNHKILDFLSSKIEWKSLIAVEVSILKQPGYLCILTDEYFTLSGYMRLAVKYLADNVSLMMSTSSHYKTLKDSFDYLKDIVELGLKGFNNIEDYLSEYLHITQRWTDSQIGCIYQATNDAQHVRLIHCSSKAEAPQKIQLSRFLLKVTNNLLYVPDTHIYINNNPDVECFPIQSSNKSVLVVPMMLDNQIWGYTYLEADRKNHFVDQIRQAVELSVVKVSEVWQNHQLLYSLEKTKEFLQDVSKEFSLQSELLNDFDSKSVIRKRCEKPIELLLDVITKTTSASSATVRMLNDNANQLILYYESKQGLQSNFHSIDVSEFPNCVLVKTIVKKQPVFIRDVRNIDVNEYPDIVYKETRSGTKSEYAQPLFRYECVDGVLNIEGPNEFTKRELGIFQTIARLIELVLMQIEYIVTWPIFSKYILVAFAAHQLDNRMDELRKHTKNLTMLTEKMTQINTLPEEILNNITSIRNEVEGVNTSALSVIMGITAPDTKPKDININEIITIIKEVAFSVEKQLTINFISECNEAIIRVNLPMLKVIIRDLVHNSKENYYANVNNRLDGRLIINVNISNKWNDSISIYIGDNGTGIIDKNIKLKLFKDPIIDSEVMFNKEAVEDQSNEPRVSFGGYICGLAMQHMGGRVYIEKTDEKGTIIGLDFERKG